MLRVSVGFAIFASSLAAQCSIKQWSDLLTAINAKTGTPTLAASFGALSNEATAISSIQTEYNTVVGLTTSTLAADCWAECAVPRYTAFYALWRPAVAASSANAGVAAGACKDDATSTECVDALAALALKDHFCAVRNVEAKTTFATGAAIEAAADGVYATVAAASGTTDVNFVARFTDAFEDAVTDSTTEAAFACYSTYYAAKFDRDGTANPGEISAFGDCKELYIASEPTACSQEAIAAIKGSTAVQTAIVAAAPGELTSLPILATAIATDLDLTDITSYSCFQCQETYLMATNHPDTGVPLTTDTTPALSVANKAKALAARDTCLAASLEVTTTTTGDGTTTEGSGVVSTGLSVAAVMAVALANL